MALCFQISTIMPGGPGSVIRTDAVSITQILELTQTEATCTHYLLQTADEVRHSYFFYGVELVDVVEVSGGVVLAWALAWGIKVLRRAL